MTRSQARRIALAAQGFGRPQPTGPVTARHLQSVVDRVAQFQIDSINIVARAHFLPLFSRLGPYDPGCWSARPTPPRRLFEYWGHAASLIDVTCSRCCGSGWQGTGTSGGVERVARENPALVDFVRDEVVARGPISARQLEIEEVRDRSSWGWNWSSVKTVLEWLFYCGEVTSAGATASSSGSTTCPSGCCRPPCWRHPRRARRSRWSVGAPSGPGARRGQRVLPPGLLPHQAEMTRTAVAALVDTGELLPVTIQGWESKPHYLWHEAALPRRITARALLSPFDSMIFERARLERLFDFSYRIEIYVPAPKRVYGYYVYPFLLDERFVARVDLKADRARGVLRVNSAWLEPGQDPGYVATSWPLSWPGWRPGRACPRSRSGPVAIWHRSCGRRALASWSQPTGIGTPVVQPVTSIRPSAVRDLRPEVPVRRLAYHGGGPVTGESVDEVGAAFPWL